MLSWVWNKKTISSSLHETPPTFLSLFFSFRPFLIDSELIILVRWRTCDDAINKQLPLVMLKLMSKRYIGVFKNLLCIHSTKSAHKGRKFPFVYERIKICTSTRLCAILVAVVFLHICKYKCIVHLNSKIYLYEYFYM